MVVSQAKQRELVRRMKRLGVKEADIEERFVRSRGAGGQKVNKTSTCVMLRHRPTGLSVKCQIARTQALNRFLARRILVEKIEGRIEGIESARRKAAEKIRRQKRRRSRRAKEKMLEEKRRQSGKKRLRARVTNNSSE